LLKEEILYYKEKFVKAFGGCTDIMGSEDPIFVSPKGEYFIISKST